jgi:hypothetical protein
MLHKINDDDPFNSFIDTGLADPAFAAPASALEEAGIKVGGGSVQGVSGAGAISVTPVFAEKLRLGLVERSNMPGIAGAFPPALERRFGFRIAGLFSHSFLRPYAVTFDFARMRIVLAK